ncbi:hypothetical protein [Streptomyces sp. NPDC086023]|uniref:hypothetical protein n=1 Tax=Streptomyces sp. NPDC086023 TaxID=3365746 RepID=UPI0037CDD23F
MTEVARISADRVIAESGGGGGVVVFTDDSIPFARNKSELIKRRLADCPGSKVLATENIPIPDATRRTPQEVSSLVSRFGDRWTHSVAINDLYFADAAPALRAAGLPGEGPPVNIGAGDGDPSAFRRINSRAYQAATVPGAAGPAGLADRRRAQPRVRRPPTQRLPGPVHVVTAANSGGATSWDPPGYQEAYRRIWRGE